VLRESKKTWPTVPGAPIVARRGSNPTSRAKGRGPSYLVDDVKSGTQSNGVSSPGTRTVIRDRRLFAGEKELEATLALRGVRRS